jgi:hypothetical protein
VKSVQTYCGLDIDIIAMMPSTSWIQRVEAAAGTASGCEIAVIFCAPSSLATIASD